MASSKFKTEVKERNPGEPCFVVHGSTDRPCFQADHFDLPIGTGLAEARQLANALGDLTVSVQ